MHLYQPLTWHSPTPYPICRGTPAKRAETRLCPACNEQIPIRLLQAHAILELQRVDDIAQHIGDAEPLPEADDLEEGPSNKSRRSALKARQSLIALQPAPRLTASRPHHDTTTSVAVERTIAHITRRRRARQTRLRELAREEASYLAEEGEDAGIACPVCGRNVRGDRDVVEAHVDMCLAHESRRAEIERESAAMPGTQGSEDTEVDIDGDLVIGDGGGDKAEQGSVRTRVIMAASLRGTGIHVRTQTQDTEDDIDVDGMDDAIFGDAQFGEADVVGLTDDNDGDPKDIDIDGKKGERSNHDRHGQNAGASEGSFWQSRAPLNSRLGNMLVAPPKTSTDMISDTENDKLDLAILAARESGNHLTLIAALEMKIKSIPLAPTCRICLSPYVDATVSTGCWHTCCALCWLRCLGATKLCPMCLRITSASELRRVYL
ncbi:hypothetical protein J3A83DRAFT_4357334 [Scleroderma citrinum]